MEQEKDNKEKNEFPEFWIAVCTCNWKGQKTISQFSAEQEGKFHEQFENNSPFGRPHFTHVEMVFGN